MKKNNERQNAFLDIMKTTDGRPIISIDLLDWLIENGFFTAPASTKYHGNYEGGLFDHSLEVMNKLLSMTEEMNLQWKRPESPFIVGMFHDLCKIDQYEFNPFCIDHKTDCILKGHGEKSIMLLSQFMTLTEEELFCIRFHMGAYNSDDVDSYGAAIEKYENVLWTHAADMYAARVRKT